MPELPEVEVIRLFLADKLVGQKVVNITVLAAKSFYGNHRQVIGQSITKLTRVGKQLSLHLSNREILLVHLKMTGQLIYSSTDRTVLGHPTKDMFIQDLPNKSTRIIISFSDGSRLFFNDQRKFGWLRLFTPKELSKFQSGLGVDIFAPRFTPKYLFSQLQKTSRPVKVLLLDQARFAGIGNIYANDALFLSRLHPKTPSNLLTLSDAKNIVRHLVAIMQQSVLAGGSTAKDKKYLKPDGLTGSNQFRFQVYQRAGEPCLACSRPIRRITLQGRGTFFCPFCQKYPPQI